MRRKDLRQRLPDLPEEHLSSVLKVINTERAKWFKEGVDTVKSLLWDIHNIAADDIDRYIVTHEDNVEGG